MLFQLGTGGGKTLIFSHIALLSQRYNRKVLILSDRSEILMQNGGALQRNGLDVQYISPKHRNIPTVNCVCSMSQTLKRRIEKTDWLEWLKTVELCIVDECHVCTHEFVYPLLSEKCFVLGVTATPSRSGQQPQLGDTFRAMVQVISIKQMIEQGYLSSVRHFSIAAPKLDVSIDYSTGDYNQKELAKRFESRTLYSGVVREYIRIARGVKAICFCVSSRQCIEVTKEFNENGISAKYLLSNSFDEDAEYSGERNEVIEQFKNGEFDVLVNVNCLTAGFDCPDVECVILNFATVSMARYRQAVGRGARVTPTKKEFIVLDCGDNWRRLGLYDADVEFSLWHSTGIGNGMQALKECDTTKVDINGRYGCGERLPVSFKVCPRCQYVFRTEKHEYEMYLEEVKENAEDDIDRFVAEKRKDGWRTSRIMVAVCLANADNVRKAFIKAYMVLNPSKTEDDARKYWFVWNKQVWSKIKHKRTDNKSTDLFGG